MPNNFELNAPNSGRKSLSPFDNPDQHLELKLVTDLKHFFMDKEVDIGEPLSQIRQTKGGKDAEKAYWQLFFLVFAAFFLDHS